MDPLTPTLVHNAVDTATLFSAPAEYVVHALASTLTSSIVNIAATRGVALTEVTSTVEGNIDLDAVLGPEPQARNGAAVAVIVDPT
jgi:hypothetical protein